MKNVWSCSSAKPSESAHPLFFGFWAWVDPNHKEKRKQRWSRHRERSFWNLALKRKSSQSLLSPRNVKQLERTGKSLHSALRCRRCLFLFSRSCLRLIWLLRNSSFSTEISLKMTWEKHKKHESLVQFSSSASALHLVVLIWRCVTNSLSHFYGVSLRLLYSFKTETCNLSIQSFEVPIFWT